MTIQPMLPFADVPATCPIQSKYHAIAPCLAGQIKPKQQAKLLNLSYSTNYHFRQRFELQDMVVEIYDEIIRRCR